MRVEILCLGTELLLDKVNTNSNAIAEKLLKIGLSVSQVSTVGDDARDIQTALRGALGRSEVVILCGGLGPTFDDLTRECVSKVTGFPLRFSEAIRRKIQKRFESVRLAMPKENASQAYLLKGAREINNAFGTAPGQIVEWKKRAIILLPGPSKECLPMMDSAVLPYLKRKFPARFAERRILHIFGYPESQIDELIEPVVRRNWDSGAVQTVFGILAHRMMVDVKATVTGPTKDRPKVQKISKEIEKALRDVLGDRIFGMNGETLEGAAGKMLKKRKQTLALAESCTGGRTANKITDIAGSSAYFSEGLVTYSNESKMRLLGVKKQTLQEFGAVSEECAKEMAAGVRKRAGADWGVSITGIAGPDGGSAAKPVGTVCFGVSSKLGTLTFRKSFFGSRTDIKEKSALCALDLLRRELLK